LQTSITRRKEFNLQIRCLMKSMYVNSYHQLLAIGRNVLHLNINTHTYLQNLRKAFLCLTSELYPVHNEKAMAKALKRVKEQHSDATFDDAKEHYVMLSLDEKISPIHTYIASFSFSRAFLAHRCNPFKSRSHASSLWSSSSLWSFQAR